MRKKDDVPTDMGYRMQNRPVQERKYSKLTPQAEKWEEDLPEKYDLQQPTPPKLIRVNEINDTWMEIPRYENIIWIGIWLSIILFLFPVAILMIFALETGIANDLFFNVISAFISISSSFFSFRMALFVPRGTPVRFNRKRQKVYVYEHQRSIWPWKRWPVVIKVFDWTDIHGEMLQQSGRYDYGHRLSCAVCKRGTLEVVDRFILSWTVGDNRMIRGLWNHCCLYMQYKPVQETPLLTRKPLSWTPLNTIRWPQALDQESRTAPE
ncbi:DUF6708 domain-containing protein [Atlantibacter sp.]|uniref:DUF6708 domain-containing protein n=1 Tax=Atlantibacter sp. TaxID=1903473 RepID=UPI0028A6F586|nr:DUF6708 domain-containing protein [Atlantibacter sp.]